MNKFLRCAAVAAMAVGFSLPTLSQADAANIVVVPLINNVVERDDLNQIYYDRVIEAVKVADADLLDGKEVDVALEKHTKQGMLPTQEEMAEIAAATNADVVFAMQADVLNRTDLLSEQTREWDMRITCEGKAAIYDINNKKAYRVFSIADSQVMPMSYGARFDEEGNMFANNVSRYVKRALGVKKVTFEKPRISKAGQKGNR